MKKNAQKVLYCPKLDMLFIEDHEQSDRYYFIRGTMDTNSFFTPGVVYAFAFKKDYYFEEIGVL